MDTRRCTVRDQRIGQAIPVEVGHLEIGMAVNRRLAEGGVMREMAMAIVDEEEERLHLLRD